MARKRIGMKKIRMLIRLESATYMSDRQTARALNISRPLAILVKKKGLTNVPPPGYITVCGLHASLIHLYQDQSCWKG
jgi:hypothetical protein